MPQDNQTKDAGADMDGKKIGFVTGLAAEAALLRGTGFGVAAGGGTPAGAWRAAELLVAQGVTALISFGLAGGLRADLRPGAVLVPNAVMEGAARYPCDGALMAWLGGSTGEAILAGETIAASATEKAALLAQFGAPAVDLESGAVARVAAAQGVRFAVLRAIADPAARNLAPAALVPLKADGGIDLAGVLRAVLRRPGQIPGLMALAGDASRARAALKTRIKQLTEVDP